MEQPSFPSPEQETRPIIGTAQAAHYLGRKQQTLRLWSISEKAPIKPLRIYGRLAWRMSDIRRALGMEG